MNAKLILIVYSLILVSAAAQELQFSSPRPISPDDPKGRNLPPGVPRMVDTNGNVIYIDHNFTTSQYRQAAFKLVLQEANVVAKELQLQDELPITKSNLVEAVITPFGWNYSYKQIGSVTTKRYCYYVSQGNKFCYLEGTHQTEDCFRYQEQYTWPVIRMDTNQAYELATQWLAAVHMDVKGLNRDCVVISEPDKIYVHPDPGKFVPVYWVSWRSRDYEKTNTVPLTHRSVASVRLFTPTRTLLQLRVEDPRYILREPLVVTNLNALFPGTAPVYTLPPPQLSAPPGPG